MPNVRCKSESNFCYIFSGIPTSIIGMFCPWSEQPYCPVKYPCSAVGCHQLCTPSIQGSTPPRDVALRNSFNAPGRALATASVDSSSAKQPPKPFICLEATVRAAPNEGCCTEWTRPNRTWEGTQLGSTSDTTYGTTWGTTG